jgi:CO/xanthine dehydrogenase FAD-binding subunit
MQVLMPKSFSEAIELKAAHPDAVPMAGGTDLLVHWPQQLARAGQIILDLSGIPELGPLRWHDDDLELGALTTYWDVLQDERAGREFPMLHEAAPQVGTIQIQSRGTWVGNVANASPAADGVPVMMAYDAVVVVTSTRGERAMALAEFFHGYRQTDLQPDELIRAIRLPRREHAFSRFIKIGPRQSQAIAKVGSALARADDGWRVVANSVAPTVLRCPSLERMLDQEAPVRGPEALLDAVDADVSPIDDLRSTAEYRRRVLARIIYYALVDVCPSFE